MLNPKQQAIVNWAKAQLKFFETSNDVKSYTHYNDIAQTLDAMEFNKTITHEENIKLEKAFGDFYTVLKNLQ